MKTNIHHPIGLIGAAILLATPLHAQAPAARGSNYVPPPQPAENAARQTAAPDPIQDPASQLAAPTSLEEQVRQLQNEVAELQTFVQQLQERIPPSDYLLGRNSPAPGLTCDRSSLTPANDILSRAYNLNDFSRRPYPDDTMVVMWSGCRR